MPQNKRTREAGNVFLIILMGIILFAALSFSISRGFRSDTTNNLSAQEAALAASDIVSFAQKVERAVNRLRRNGCSENDISFYNADIPILTFYLQTPATDDACRVFNPAGGNIQWQTVPEKALIDTANNTFSFTGQLVVEDVGTVAPELLMLSPNINVDTCKAINVRLGLAGAGDEPFNDTVGFNAGTFFYVGSFTTEGTFGDEASNPFLGQSSGCREIQGAPGEYQFFQTLIER